MKSDEAYMQALGALGVAPEDIDFVMCTHLHSDHNYGTDGLRRRSWDAFTGPAAPVGIAGA
jgi:glyoxylase-like metal-dependent hydrolase (beta-lactamase superfamily II)